MRPSCGLRLRWFLKTDCSSRQMLRTRPRWHIVRPTTSPHFACNFGGSCETTESDREADRHLDRTECAAAFSSAALNRKRTYDGYDACTSWHSFRNPMTVKRATACTAGLIAWDAWLATNGASVCFPCARDRGWRRGLLRRNRFCAAVSDSLRWSILIGSVTNTNRQLKRCAARWGKLKAQVLAERLALVNPANQGFRDQSIL